MNCTNASDIDYRFKLSNFLRNHGLSDNTVVPLVEIIENELLARLLQYGAHIKKQFYITDLRLHKSLEYVDVCWVDRDVGENVAIPKFKETSSSMEFKTYGFIRIWVSSFDIGQMIENGNGSVTCVDYI